ncbi:EF0163 family protein [Lactococcus garvieae]|uniref:EF0163 family protein n=1 Tax=Lactococcus garvieae TaxID=1363 RepID=UPI00254D8EE0|nr:EF0163 family protein [Lactococcus garvieae]
MKKLNLLLFGVSSLLLLSACSNNQIVKPDKVEISSSQQIKKSSSDEKVESNKLSESLSTSEDKFEATKAKDVVKKFLDSYYNYDSENKRNELSKAFCNTEVQKKLHLVKVDKEIKMESSITTSDIYEGEEGQYLVLVTYSLNGNQVTPQVLKINVEQEGNQYLISSVDFPLMN